MADTPLNTLVLHDLVGRWQAGDRAAADQLILAAGSRLEHLSNRMLSQYPAVRSHAESADVLQGSLLRLLSALRSICPSSTRDFYNLAAVQTRRELIDL